MKKIVSAVILLVVFGPLTAHAGAPVKVKRLFLEGIDRPACAMVQNAMNENIVNLEQSGALPDGAVSAKTDYVTHCERGCSSICIASVAHPEDFKVAIENAGEVAGKNRQSVCQTEQIGPLPETSFTLWSGIAEQVSFFRMTCWLSAIVVTKK